MKESNMHFVKIIIVPIKRDKNRIRTETYGGHESFLPQLYLKT